MRNIIRILLTFCFVFNIIAQTDVDMNGSVCAYKLSDGLKFTELKVEKKEFVTNTLEFLKTYNIDLNTFEINTKTNEFANLLFANDVVVRIEENSQFRVDGFNMSLKNIPSYPSKIEVDTYNMNLALMEGDAYFIISKNNTNDQFLLQTLISNLELETGKYYIQSNKKSVLVYVLDGSIGIYDNITNKKETVKSGNVVLIHPSMILSPKQLELFGDKMTTNVKKTKPEQVKPFVEVITEMEFLKKDIIFINVNTNIVGVKIK